MSVREALPSAALAIACAAAAIATEASRDAPAAAQPHAPSITPRAAELLDGLQVGQRVAGWTVIALDGPRDRAIEVGFERDGQRFVVTIAPMGARPENPALQTDRYAIYYGHAVPPDTKIPDGAVRAITAGLARRIGKHEADIPEP
ncbi:MAG TPA: hypothetical protein VG755_13810 [Nannocystaceae bacterium]|nr:hypothetical protein [Nannocystaceae bacterium]